MVIVGIWSLNGPAKVPPLKVGEPQNDNLRELSQNQGRNRIPLGPRQTGFDALYPPSSHRVLAKVWSHHMNQSHISVGVKYRMGWSTNPLGYIIRKLGLLLALCR